MDITILSRRSRRFAGTRYLRRGVNADGDVANEVETEQVVWRATPGSHGQGKVASFVQLRGSVPLVWSHTNLSHPKPDIVVADPAPGVPYTRLHFEKLAKRYGLPIVCLSLVKVRACEASRGARRSPRLTPTMLLHSKRKRNPRSSC